MFSQDNNQEKKLDWMYKGPTSSVDREEYLLGRSIDKGLEQINSGDKAGQSANSHPKNHVEHECIPPSIRDFKKMQIGEQVDLAQKLQEDPLVAIRKREEETRQKLLQNPVKLKQLQKVLKLKKDKKNKKKRKTKKKGNSDSSNDSQDSKRLDKKYSKKYEELKKHMHVNEEPEEDEMDKILIKKFMQFKHLLTKKDLDEILNTQNGSGSSSDEEMKKQNKYKPDSDHNDSSDENTKRKNKGFNNKRDGKGDKMNMGRNATRYKRNFVSNTDENPNRPTTSNYRRNIQQDTRSFEERNKNRSKHMEDPNQRRNRSISDDRRNRRSSPDERTGQNKKNREEMNKRRSGDIENVKKQREEADRKKFAEHQKRTYKNRRSSSSSTEVDETRYRKKNKESRKRRRKLSSSDSSSSDDDRKKKNMKKSVLKSNLNSSDSSNEDIAKKYTYNEDSDENRAQRKRNFGLVKADGTKIHLPKKKGREKREDKRDNRKEVPENIQSNKDIHKRHRLTEEEKEQKRREMMQNAEWRDEERERNVKRYREEDSKETKSQEYDTDFIKRELLKSANNSTVESRIKSNVYNIQRSGKDMSTNFSRRY